MTLRTRAVIVKQLPEQIREKQSRLFLAELATRMDGERPRVVLDCSLVKSFDHAIIELLMSCLEEALKRNGDLRLAGVSGEGEQVLAKTGVHRLFQIFAGVPEASSSFHRASIEAIARRAANPEIGQRSEVRA